MLLMLRVAVSWVHPDFGTVDVMVDSWECRTKADELNYYAFTVTVYPSLQDTAPDSETDTSAAVPAQAVAVTGSLGDTLSSVWQTVKMALRRQPP
ncbi:hypothetical protein O5476_00050 [Escherichia coli]|nr:hypothetical protein [Escherichia coli]